MIVKHRMADIPLMHVVKPYGLCVWSRLTATPLGVTGGGNFAELIKRLCYGAVILAVVRKLFGSAPKLMVRGHDDLVDIFGCRNADLLPDVIFGGNNNDDCRQKRPSDPIPIISAHFVSPERSNGTSGMTGCSRIPVSPHANRKSDFTYPIMLKREMCTQLRN
jgi:hypothetical protein